MKIFLEIAMPYQINAGHMSVWVSTRDGISIESTEIEIEEATYWTEGQTKRESDDKVPQTFAAIDAMPSQRNGNS